MAVVRRMRGYVPVVLLINGSNQNVTVDASSWLNIPERMNVYVSSVYSNIPKGIMVNTGKLSLPGAATVILGNGTKMNF